eukprot:Phypoly_transcript_17423.p1 GENE.Phypoly_transcript_17423~~Phypoly_transcript_17423.p1  ORF type:complete len:226 (+),score=29.61 Phypoly_transcript_17423:42-719(+)
MSSQQEIPYVIRHALVSDLDDSTLCHFETWSTCYTHGYSSKFLEYTTLHPWLYTKRQKVYEKVAQGKAVSLVAEWTSSTLPPPKSLLNPSNALRLVGHCDMVIPGDPFPFKLSIHPSSPTTTLEEDLSNTLEIYSLYVHPSMHGTGCAQRLFACGVRAGLRRFTHAQRMIVMAFETNKPARRFYEKMGGRLYKVLSGFPEDGKFWDVLLYEWLDLPTWVQKWEQM